MGSVDSDCNSVRCDVICACQCDRFFCGEEKEENCMILRNNADKKCYAKNLNHRSCIQCGKISVSLSGVNSCVDIYGERHGHCVFKTG